MIKSFFTDEGIFYVKFLGIVSLDDINSFLEEFVSKKYTSENLLSLYDLHGAELNFDISHIKTVADKADIITTDFKNVKTAFVVNKPDLSVYSILFIENSTSKKNRRNVFSTEESALKWLTNN